MSPYPIQVLQVFRCAKGHEIPAVIPFEVTLTCGEVQVKTGPLCIICLGEFLSTSFPAAVSGDVFNLEEEEC